MLDRRSVASSWRWGWVWPGRESRPGELAAPVTAAGYADQAVSSIPASTPGCGSIGVMNDEGVSLRELTDGNRQEVLALRVAPGQERFVSSVTESLEEAEAYPQASPWYRAVYVGEVPVGFVMLSWDVCRNRRRSLVRGSCGGC